MIAGTASIVMQILAPRYVQSVLEEDAANAVYVFAPTVLGLLLAVATGPLLVKKTGERIAALAGFTLIAAALSALGAVAEVARLIDFLNPLRALDLAGLDLSRKLRTAGLLALPLGYGVALTTTSVQTYINRRVPLAFQGKTFALQSALKNGASVVPLLTLGAAATTFGTESVLVASPLVLVAIAYALIYLSSRFTGILPPSGLEVLGSFWEELPEDEEAEAPGETARQ